MTAFNISVTSDTVCPWCYVGKNKLEAGIRAYQQQQQKQSQSGDNFSISWKPFYLNPDAPQKGTDKQAMYESRFGRDRTAQIQQRLSAEGAKVGIAFRYGGKTGNTRNSHRLIKLAAKQDLQNRVVEELFKSYFEEERDITDLEVLRDAGVRAGLEAGLVESWLHGEDGGREVDEEVSEARAGLVTGVPHFVINGKYEIQGAQDAEGFRRIFERIKEIEGK